MTSDTGRALREFKVINPSNPTGVWAPVSRLAFKSKCLKRRMIAVITMRGSGSTIPGD